MKRSLSESTAAVHSRLPFFVVMLTRVSSDPRRQRGFSWTRRVRAATLSVSVPFFNTESIHSASDFEICLSARRKE